MPEEKSIPADSPSSFFWLRWPRTTLILFGISLVANFALTGLNMAESLRNLRAPTPLVLPSDSSGKNQSPSTNLVGYRTGALLYSTYFWTERGNARAGGTDPTGVQFRNGFGRARYYLKNELPPLLKDLGISDPDDVLKPAIKAVEANDRDRAQLELNNLSRQVSSFLEGKAIAR